MGKYMEAGELEKLLAISTDLLSHGTVKESLTQGIRNNAMFYSLRVPETILKLEKGILLVPKHVSICYFGSKINTPVLFTSDSALAMTQIKFSTLYLDGTYSALLDAQKEVLLTNGKSTELKSILENYSE